jgi:hypothetical protein
MNQQQVLSVTRDIMQAIGTLLAAYGVVNSGVWETISGVVVMVIPVAWGLWVHTQASTIAVVAAMDTTKVEGDGKTIKILDPKLQEVAKDNATAPKPIQLII